MTNMIYPTVPTTANFQIIVLAWSAFAKLNIDTKVVYSFVLLSSTA